MPKGKPQITDSEVVDLYDRVCAAEPNINWFAFTCNADDEVVMCGSGSGGVDELRANLKENEIYFGFAKVADRFALVSFISLDAASSRVSSALLMLQEIKVLFVHHYFLDFTRPEELTVETIKANAREGHEEITTKPPSLKERTSVKKKKKEPGAEGTRKKKKEGSESKDGDDEKRRLRKKKSEVLDLSGDMRKASLDDKASSTGMKRPKKSKDGSEDATEKKKKSDEGKERDGPASTSPPPTISIDEVAAPVQRKKSLKSKKKAADELLPVVSGTHRKEASASSAHQKHSRDASGSSDISDDTPKQYLKAVNHHIAKTDEDLMFLKGDIIQLVERVSDRSWLGICCGVEGTFDPTLVMLLPPGFKPKMEASGSEISFETVSDEVSDSDGEGEGSDAPVEPKPGEFTETSVVEWLYAAGFPQYVDMHQKHQVVDEGEVVQDHSFLSPLQIQSLLKRIRFLNEKTHASLGTTSNIPFQPADALPISPNWNDSSPTDGNGYDSLPSTQPGWGENLTRSKSKKKKKAKSINELDEREMDIARKLAVLSITAMQEKSNKDRVTDFAVRTLNLIVGKKEEKEARVFGAELADVVERTGMNSKWTTGRIPRCLYRMLEAFDREEILKTVGLFRVPGKQNRINQLREQCDAKDGEIDFTGLSGADLSGIIKLFFSKLPDTLFTSELYKSYAMVASLTNKRVQIETLQLLSILLPKENREIAACLLKLLSQVSFFKDVNKMDTRNLALVLAPTLFGDRRKRALKPSQADIDKDLQRQNKIAEVLQVMIECQSVLWMLPVDLQEQLEYTLQGNKAEKKKRWFFTSGRYPTM